MEDDRNAKKPVRLVVIGNSLTRHLPNAELAWPHDWGMAASSRERDFAHLAAKALGLPVEVRNIADFEGDPASHGASLAEAMRQISESTWVVVELGDNTRAETLKQFHGGYEQLLAAAKGAKLACLSTWWDNNSLDAKLKNLCENNGGRYVYIGDIHRSPANPDKRSGPQYANASVNDHPHDWGMARIAERVVAALSER